MPESARVVTAFVGVGRAVMGASLIARPRNLATTLGVDTASAARTDFEARLLGVRDVALGLGAAFAAGTGAPVRTWLLAQALSDAADCVVFLSGAASGRFAPLGGYGIGVFAGSGAVAEAALAARVSA
jgi:hypothetical protein